MGRQAMTGMDDVERQTVHGDPEILEKKKKANDRCVSYMAGIFIVAVAVCVFVPLVVLQVDAHYYVSIDSVSHLDDPSRGGLSFNLTLGVVSRSYGAKACMKPGTYVEVSYRGALLAIGEAEVGRLCAGPRKSAEQRVVARMAGVPDGRVPDSLAADVKQGAPLYEVTLLLPDGSFGVPTPNGEKNWASRCERTQVGAAAVWCEAPDQKLT